MSKHRTIPRLCEICAQPFDARLDHIEQGGGRFCSRACFSKYRIERTHAEFWKRLTQHGKCLLWTQLATINGYGILSYRGRQSLAHRVAWEIANGPIPNGMCVLHRCDVPACCNPEHLFLGTQADNLSDMRDKGREARGGKHGIAKLTSDDVREIRQRLRNGESQRAIARRFGIAQSNVSLIHHNKTWNYIK